MLNNIIVKQVRDLNKGQAIEIDRHYLEAHVQSFRHNGANFTAADRVLENIIGAAYEYSYSESHMNGNVTFHRLEQPLRNGQKSYTSPDRR